MPLYISVCDKINLQEEKSRMDKQIEFYQNKLEYEIDPSDFFEALEKGIMPYPCTIARSSPEHTIVTCPQSLANMFKVGKLLISDVRTAPNT
jgi:hypothetical protein